MILKSYRGVKIQVFTFTLHLLGSGLRPRSCRPQRLGRRRPSSASGWSPRRECRRRPCRQGGSAAGGKGQGWRWGRSIVWALSIVHHAQNWVLGPAPFCLWRGLCFIPGPAGLRRLHIHVRRTPSTGTQILQVCHTRMEAQDRRAPLFYGCFD